MKWPLQSTLFQPEMSVRSQECRSCSLQITLAQFFFHRKIPLSTYKVPDTRIAHQTVASFPLTSNLFNNYKGIHCVNTNHWPSAFLNCSCSLNNSRTSSLAGIFHPTFTRTSGNLKVKHSSTMKDFTLNAGIPQRIQQYKCLTSMNKTLSACSLLIRTGDVWLRLILQ